MEQHLTSIRKNSLSLRKDKKKKKTQLMETRHYLQIQLTSINSQTINLFNSFCANIVRQTLVTTYTRFL